MLVTIDETGAGTDAIPSVSAEAVVGESGAGTDAIATVEAATTISESGAGTDVLAARADAAITDSGVGTEALSPQARVTLTDSGTGSEVVTPGILLTMSDQGIGIDFTYRVQGEISLDSTSLPHVLSLNVEEPSIVQDLPVMDALPYRRQLGKKGRSVKIQGWTDSLSTLETLRGYADGNTHLLMLPTGDSIYVLLSDVRTPDNVENYDRYDYEVDAMEVVD